MEGPPPDGVEEVQGWECSNDRREQETVLRL